MLKNGKVPKENAIVSELLKKRGKNLMAQLKRLVDIIWKHRGIFLLNTSYKMVSKIILNQIKPYSREIIGEYQSGFIPGRSTVNQMPTYNIMQISRGKYRGVVEAAMDLQG